MSALRVVEPGLFTTVQDLGRPHAMVLGIPAGGAMDRFAHRAANRLAGNDDGAATLECTVKGPVLQATRACLVAIAGGSFEPRVNGAAVPMWTAIALASGDRLEVGRRRDGARAYLALAGGVAADRWLGSLSTDLKAGRGGMHGRALVTGDEIASARTATATTAGRELAARRRPDYTDHRLHVIQGPHFDSLPAASRELLFGAEFAVGHASDRMGYRLTGPHLDSAGDEVLSFGLVAGAMQLPRGGAPILLMADHQTVGGYPVIATVVGASLPVAAQLAPGDQLTFAPITPEKALRLRADQREALDSLIS